MNQLPYDNNDDSTEEKASIDPYRETVIEFIKWLDKTGREFPISEEPLLQAVFTKTRISKNDIGQFGLKLLSFKGKLEKIDVFEVAQTIVQNFDPYRKEWKEFEHLPGNLKAIARRYYVIDFLIESLLTLNFSSGNLRESWHDVIYTTMNEYLTLTETIRRLGVFYWKKFFEIRFIKDVPPLLNYYKDLFDEDLNTLLSGQRSDETSTEILLLANNIMEIWNIYFRYNSITDDPLLLPMEWISETLYKKIVPSIQDNISFTTRLSPEKLNAFLNQPIDKNVNYSVDEQEDISRFRSDFTYSIATKYSNIANSQLAQGEVFQSLISSSWVIYYLMLCSRVNNDYIVHSKPFWTEYYKNLEQHSKYLEYILFHYSILVKCISAKNLPTQVIDLIFESLVLLDHDTDKQLPTIGRKNLQELQNTIVGIEGFINYPKEILQIFQPLLQPLLDIVQSNLSEPIKTVYSHVVSQFKSYNNSRKLFVEKNSLKMKILDQFTDQIGIFVHTKKLDEKLDKILKNIGLDLDFSSEVQKGDNVKAFDKLYKGWIGELGFELQIMLQTSDETQTLVSWQLSWTKISENQNILYFVNWMKIFLEAIFRLTIREVPPKREGSLMEQKCVNCDEMFRNQPRSSPFYVYCPKCRYPQIPY